MEEPNEEVVGTSNDEQTTNASSDVVADSEVPLDNGSSSQEKQQETEEILGSNDENVPVEEEEANGKNPMNDDEDSLDPETEEEDPYPLRKGFNDDDTDAEPDELDIEIARLQALMKIDDPDMDEEPEVTLPFCPYQTKPNQFPIQSSSTLLLLFL